MEIVMLSLSSQTMAHLDTHLASSITQSNMANQVIYDKEEQQMSQAIRESECEHEAYKAYGLTEAIITSNRM